MRVYLEFAAFALLVFSVLAGFAYPLEMVDCATVVSACKR